MDYEKLYKEALERAKDMLSYKEVRKEDMEYLFPELKESEDERVRKEILGLVQYTKGRRIGYEPRVHQDEMIAWLEKHGEKNFDYEHADIPQKDFAPIEPKTLDADKVIEWLKTNVYDESPYGMGMIYQFKKYFNL